MKEIIFSLLCATLMISCNPAGSSDSDKNIDMSGEYAQKLLYHRTEFPFDVWRTYPDDGLEQYTAENCDRAEEIMMDLIRGLVGIGEEASDEEKIKVFEKCVLALNDLNDAAGDGLIETGEREQLFFLIDHIGLTAGLNPKDYGGGEGIASEWRDW